MLRHRGKRVRDAYKREPRLTTREWAEKHIIINNSQVSPITGQFNVKYSPHLIKLMELWDVPKNREFYAKWAAQSAKSFFLVSITGKRLDTEPSNVLYMQPIKDDIPKIIDVKIDPLLKCMPRLWQKFEDYKLDESIRGKREIKRMAGGNLIVTGSGVKDRKSLTVPMMVFDEAAEFEQGTIAEAKDRIKTFTKFFPKIFGASTIVHPLDEICTAYASCQAQLEWHYNCPKCSEHFYPGATTFKYLQPWEFAQRHECMIDEIDTSVYLDEAKASAHVECPYCTHKITNADKDRMLFNGGMDWYYLKGDDTATSYGVSMNSLGSYFITFETLAEELVRADNVYERVEKIYRSWFNEFYERKLDVIESNDLLLLGNSLDKWVVPEDSIRCYLGIDTQKDHFWWEIRAYGYGKQSHTVAQGRAETFDDLEKIWELAQNLVSVHGEVFYADKLGIDRRGFNQDGVKRTEEVDAWVRKMTALWRRGDENRIYATEGEPKLTGDKPYIIQTRKDETDNRVKVDIKVMKISNIYLKTAIRTAMSNTIEMAKSEFPEDYNGMPKFFVNQTTIDADAKGTTSISYTRQISAEVYDHARDKNGKLAEEKSFINPSQKDNHFFDTSCICEAFAQKDQIYMERKPDNSDLSEALKGIFL